MQQLLLFSSRQSLFVTILALAICKTFLPKWSEVLGFEFKASARRADWRIDARCIAEGAAVKAREVRGHRCSIASLSKEDACSQRHC